MRDDEGLGMRQQTGPVRGTSRPRLPDALEMPYSDHLETLEMHPGDQMESAEDGQDRELFASAPEVATPAWYRAQARQVIREFLRAVPRSEPDVPLAFVGPDGQPHTLTRAQLSARIDRLRPRQRQIIRLSVEERWTRQRVCEYLSHISYKTLERDQVEALDLLAQMEEG